ncbi:nucleoside permease [Ensifer adhaerens]|uniref:nucleoside permease n=1 Tax=Ensifer adhaerens TaxID=106592 RepID=UPI000CF077E2|nr:nucleoside permease [Ensifer adhaerens]
MPIAGRLKMLSFLQYFIWGSWLVTLGSYMIKTLGFTGLQVGAVYSTKGLAAIIMPGLIGIIADKLVPANRLYMLCHFASGITLFYAASVNDPTLMFWVMLANMLTFMPTIALSNSISYYCLSKHKLDAIATFPHIRVFGTVGFIAAMWTISLLRLELSNVQLYIAAGASMLLCVYSTTLPHIPIASGKRKQNLAGKLGLDAFVLFKQPKMAVFFLFAMLLGVVLQITNTFGNPFLHDFANNPAYRDSIVARYPSMLLSISQISEVLFILTIPFFLKRFGIKAVMLISMLAWTLRFGFFAVGDPSPVGFVLLTLSMIAYGCAFDFFNVSGSIFIEREVDPSIRASAQGLFMTTVNGLGAFVGAWVSGMVVDYFTTDGTRDWASIWLLFAAYTLVLAVIFFFSFQYRHVPEGTSTAAA